MGREGLVCTIVVAWECMCVLHVCHSYILLDFYTMSCTLKVYPILLLLQCHLLILFFSTAGKTHCLMLTPNHPQIAHTVDSRRLLLIIIIFFCLFGVCLRLVICVILFKLSCVFVQVWHCVWESVLPYACIHTSMSPWHYALCMHAMREGVVMELRQKPYRVHVCM